MELCVKALAFLKKESEAGGRVYFCVIILVFFSAMCLFFIQIILNFFYFLPGCNIVQFK